MFIRVFVSFLRTSFLLYLAMIDHCGVCRKQPNKAFKGAPFSIIHCGNEKIILDLLQMQPTCQNIYQLELTLYSAREGGHFDPPTFLC